MPHIPDTLHDTHDLELVAAYAAGDASGETLDRALALVAACGDCAALHHDLRAIAAAMPELPAPVRPRDFRLSAEQAASLRPSGLRGFLSTLAGPRFSFATPLGTGLAALGIVGVLVASGGLGTGGATSGGAQPEAATSQVQGEAPVDANAAASEAPASLGIELYAPDAASSDAAPSDAAPDPYAAAPAESMAPVAGGVGDDGGTEALVLESPAPDVLTSRTSAKDLAAEGTAPFVAPAFAVLLAGLVLVAVRWWARRVA